MVVIMVAVIVVSFIQLFLWKYKSDTLIFLRRSHSTPSKLHQIFGVNGQGDYFALLLRTECIHITG